MNKTEREAYLEAEWVANVGKEALECRLNYGETMDICARKAYELIKEWAKAIKAQSKSPEVKKKILQNSFNRIYLEMYSEYCKEKNEESKQTYKQERIKGIVTTRKVLEKMIREEQNITPAQLKTGISVLDEFKRYNGEKVSELDVKESIRDGTY